MIKKLTLVLGILMLSTQLACAVEGGVAVKNDTLRAEPFQDAKSAGALVKGEHADILKSTGGWMQIKTAKSKGWVRMLSIRRDAARSTGKSGSSLAALASGRSGTGKIVATTGIRGLNEEELKAAKYDEAQVTLAESYSSSKSDAQSFAKQGKLVARKVDYLPVPGGAK